MSSIPSSVLDRIVESDVVDLTLALGNISGSQPHEARVAQYVYEWMSENGFEPRKLGHPERFNVLGQYRGTGGGYSLIFNSHLDTERVEPVRLRDTSHPGWHSAWRDGERLHGYAVANDRGPMAAFMIAAKAIKDSGCELKGTISLSMVVGETGGSPVDEFQGHEYDSHELGARYLASHGGVADYALVAEATNFGIATAECGFAYLKVTVHGSSSTYTPVSPPRPHTESHNAAVLMADFVTAFEEYATVYEQRNTRQLPGGGTQIAKASIGAIRAGSPYYPVMSPELASAYIDVRTLPGADPREIQSEVEAVLVQAGLQGTVEIYKALPGFEAKGADRLIKHIQAAQLQVRSTEAGPAASKFTSMWRDINPFNEAGIPAVTYSVPTGYSDADYYAQGRPKIEGFNVKVEDLVDCAKIYAGVALGLCNEPRPAGQSPTS